VIRLQSTSSDDGIGALLERVGHQKFQFARLVAATCQSRAVISLDKDPRSAKVV
jgi:hypothetical protein